ISSSPSGKRVMSQTPRGWPSSLATFAARAGWALPARMTGGTAWVSSMSDPRGCLARMSRPSGLVLDLFRAQHGLISRRQALEAGMGESAVRWRLEHGDWEVVGPGVYRLPGTVETWWQRGCAVCLQGAPDAALSHGSAAYAWGLDGFNRYEPKL